MEFEVEVNITEKQILEEFEYWSQDNITKFIFKVMPKIEEYWTNNIDPKYSLPFITQLLTKTIKSMKYEAGNGPRVKEMIKELKEMATKITEIEDKYYECTSDEDE